MNLLKKYLTVVILLFGIIYLVHSQQKYNIWDGHPTYSTVNGDTISEIYEELGFKSVKNITIPSVIAYLPEKPNGMAVIICPGGAYGFEAIDVEGTKVAEWFQKNDITAFVLKYRLPDNRYMQHKEVVPMLDAFQAINYVRRNAAKWNLDGDKIGIMGFSAGGHLASSVSVHYTDAAFNDSPVLAKPNFSVLVYPVIFSGSKGHQGSSENLLGKDAEKKWFEYFSNDKQVKACTPPTILFHSANDATVPVENSIAYFWALKKNNIKAELHIFNDGDHGYGFPNDKSSGSHTLWPEILIKWLKSLYN